MASLACLPTNCACFNAAPSLCRKLAIWREGPFLLHNGSRALSASCLRLLQKWSWVDTEVQTVHLVLNGKSEQQRQGLFVQVLMPLKGGNMTTITLLSRHEGAIHWARQQLQALGIQGEERVLSHLKEEAFQPGDVVCGVLPLGLAARLCQQGVRVLAIDMVVPEHLRGVELSAEQLDALQARLVQYEVAAHTLTPDKQAASA
jgi:CRISPR-associated protein Csx16